MLTKQILLGSLFSFFLIASIGCSDKNHYTPHLSQFIAFGTEINLIIYSQKAPQSQKALENIQSQFYQLHLDWHAWEENGILSQINQAIKYQQAIKVPLEVKNFILKSQVLSKQSNYLFDPGIGQLIRLWGFHSENWQGPPPSKEKRQTWLESRPSIADLEFNGLILTSTNPNVSLDFGGNAKGLALDKAINILKQHQIENALINIGGDMSVIGNKGGDKNRPWNIGIKSPFSPNKPVARIQLQGNETIVTSGNYQRYFMWKDKRYSHIINPNTAWPADTFASVTIIHNNATIADTAATAIMIAGKKHWQEVATQMGIEKIFIIDQNQQIITSDKMQPRITIISNNH